MLVAPRDYQAEARDTILATWGERPWYKGGETYRSCVLNIPTSSGKTIIAGLVCESICHRGKFLYLADRDVLCEQPADKFERLLGIDTVLEKAEKYADLNAPVVIGSLQTFSKQHRLERFPWNHFSYIFVDEAHRHVDQAQRVINYFSEAKVCGQTATAFRAKLKDLSAYYETVAYELGVFSLIDEGFIVPIKVKTFPVEIDLSEVGISKVFGEDDYNADDLDTTIEPYFERIAELIKEHCAGRQILCFLPLIVSSEKFVGIARSHGINARHIDGAMSEGDKQKLLQGFEKKEFQLISCSSLLSTGWDCPPCDTLLNLTPTRSAGMWRQKVGRILRVLPGVIDGIKAASDRRQAIAASEKPSALIVDLLYHTDEFGLQGPADLIAKNAEEREAIAEVLATAEGEALDLEEVTEGVQEAREAELKAQLEQAARRKEEREKAKAKGLCSALHFALIMHDKDLLAYEPVSRWHNHPISDKQRAFLERNWIDPDSVQDKGHAYYITNKIWGRKQANLCSYRTVVALEAKNIPGARHYSEEQAYRQLGFDYPFPFGKHAAANHTLRQVPYGYWDWLKRQDWAEKDQPLLWAHMIKIGVVKAEGVW